MFQAHSADWGGMADRRPDLDDGRLQVWKDLVEQRTGIVITAERRAFLAAGLRARMQQTGAADYDDYFRRLCAERVWSEEWAQLVDRLTVHETTFFRHVPSLQLFSELLPELLAASHSLQIWSAGCATGEEPYSLAMLTQAQIAATGGNHLFGITATDISQPALQTASAGIYSERRAQGIPGEFRTRFCDSLDHGRLQITEQLRRRVCFAQQDILKVAGFPLRGLNIIYCQNMLIYFPRYQRLQIVETFAQRLEPGGVLILGPGDLPCWSHSEFERIRFEGTLAFRRLGAGTANA